MMAVFRTCLRTRNARSPGKVLSLSLSRPPPIEMRDMFFFFDPSGARGETAGRSPRGGPRVGPRTDRCIKWRDPPVEVDVRRASCPLPVRPPSRISARYFSGALGAPPRARTAPPRTPPRSPFTSLRATLRRGARSTELGERSARRSSEREFSDRADPRTDRRLSEVKPRSLGAERPPTGGGRPRWPPPPPYGRLLR